MKYMVASGSRSGSMFTLKMLEAFVGADAYPMAKISSSRHSVGDFSPAYSDFRKENDLVGFVKHHELRSIKVEDPGLDDDADILFDAFPDCVVLATFRPVEMVVNSHGNIKPWGMPPDKVVQTWIGNLAFYEKAHEARRLVLIPLNDKTLINPGVAAQLLGKSVTDTVRAFIDNWPSVNDLRHQKQVSNDETPTDFFMSRDELVDRFHEIPDAEARYCALTLAANAPKNGEATGA